MRGSFADAIVDEEVLGSGCVRLTPGAANSIGLPKETVERELRFGDEWIPVVWLHDDRLLGGEALRDLLEVEATLESVLRLLREDDGTIAISLIDRSMSTVGRLALRRARGEPRSSDRGVEAPESDGGSVGARSDRDRPTEVGAPRPEEPASVAELEDPMPGERPGRPVRRSGPATRSARRSRDRMTARTDDEFDWYGDVGVSRSSRSGRIGAIEARRWTDPESFEMRVSGEELAAASGFDELLALDMCAIDHMPHQVGTALAVLRNLDGRAILADEVGLGKTIEAGLIIKELLVRQMATSVLIICPATLRDQWREEMSSKFDESFETIERGTDRPEHDRVILSHQMAQRRVDELTSRPWDIVVVDEAHRMSGPGARKSRELLTGLESRYALYLTATPVQNDLLDLYRLVDTLRPGTFTSQADFRRRFMSPENPREPKDPAALRRLVADVMVRTTRAQAGLDRVQRIPVDHRIEMSDAERFVYDFCLETLRTELNGPHDSMRRRFLAHRLTASPRALAHSLQRLAEGDVKPNLRRTLEEMVDLCIDFGVTERQRRLLALSHEWIADRDKGRVLIFTQHTDTLQDLDRVLTGQGLETVTYHGQMSATAKRRSIEEFASDRGPRVMLSSDAGAEGLNLQFANCVVNYDLPWNPMRIEQRIGRVHRVTQTRDVHVANLYAANTVDEAVYRLLHDKLRMFELLFGQVTTILGELDETRDAGTFEDRIMDAVIAADDRVMRAKLDELGRSVDTAYARARAQSADGDHLNTWVLDRSHRKGLTREGSSELRPEPVVSEGERRTAVEDFVHRYLERTGATILWEQRGSAQRSGFVSAGLPSEVAEQLGRDELHLAFGADSLDLHVSAELCVVGMGIFDELVATIADDSEVLALVPSEAVLEPTEAWIGGADGYEFVERRIGSFGQWGGRAVWHVRNRALQEGPKVLTTFIRDDTDERGAADVFRPLAAGEELAVSDMGSVVGSIIEASIPQIDEMAEDSREKIAEAHERERERLKRHYDEQIAETLAGARGRGSRARRRENRELFGRLERARDELMSRRPPKVQLEADLLALHLVPDTEVGVVETWRDPEGKTFEFSYDWTVGSGRPASIPGADGRAIETLSQCRRAHVVDLAVLERCPVCSENTCGACSDGVRFTCSLCSLKVCGSCAVDERDRGSWVKGDAVLCPGCHDPHVVESGEKTVLALGNGWHASVARWSVHITDDAGRTIVDHVLPERRAAIAYPQIDRIEGIVGAEVGLRVHGTIKLHENDLFTARSETIARWSVEHHHGRLESLREDAVTDAVLSELDEPTAGSFGVGLEPLMERWMEVLATRHGFGSGPTVHFSRHQIRHELRTRGRPILRRVCVEIDADPTVSEFHFEELSERERAELPSDLLLTGAVSVRAARDEDLVVLAIRSAGRREIAVLDRDHRTMWVTSETDEPETELQFRFAAGLGDGGLELCFSSQDAPPPAETAQPLREYRRWFLEVEASDSSGASILTHDLGEVDDPDPRSHLARIAQFAGPAPAALPRPGSASEAKVLAAVLAGVVAPVPKVRLAILTRVEVDRIELIPEGMSRLWGRVPDLVVENARWEPASSEPAEPDLPMHGEVSVLDACELADFRAMTVHFGPYLLLSMAAPDGSRSLWRLDDLPHFPAGAVASQMLGTGVELPRPTTWVPPPAAAEAPFTVDGYERVDRSLVYETVFVETTASDEDAEERFYEFVEVEHATEIEPTDVLPHGLRRSLAAGFGFEPAVIRQGVRVRVTERWEPADRRRAEDRSGVLVEYRCEPDGPELDEAHLGSVGPELQVDRSGHVTDHAATCPYCVEAVCDSCPEPMTTCLACEIRICARCLSETGYCEACGATKKLGFLGRRSLPGRPKHAVVGRDRVHQVIYMLDTDGEVTMVLKGRGIEPFQCSVTLPAPLAEQFAQLAGGTWPSRSGDHRKGPVKPKADDDG